MTDGDDPPAKSGTFTDRDSDDDAYWNVRSRPLGVAVALSLASDGDIDVVMDQHTAREFANAVLWAIDPTPSSSH